MRILSLVCLIVISLGLMGCQSLRRDRDAELDFAQTTGEIAEDGFGGKWGGAKRGGDPLKWRGSDYFDEGDIWTDGLYLCGNQVSGAPRHRRDNLTHWLISPQASTRRAPTTAR